MPRHPCHLCGADHTYEETLRYTTPYLCRFADHPHLSDVYAYCEPGAARAYVAAHPAAILDGDTSVEVIVDGIAYTVPIPLESE